MTTTTAAYMDETLTSDTMREKVLLEKISDIIMCYSDIHYAVEMLKQDLLGLNEFNEYKVFKRLDMRKMGRINHNDIRIFMEENEVYMNSRETKLLFSYFDLNERGFLEFEDLMRILLPKSKTKSGYNNLPLSTFGDRLSEPVEVIVAEILKEELNFVIEVESMKSSLDFGEFSPGDVFRGLDEEVKGYIDARNIFDFLTENFDNVTYKMCLGIFERIHTRHRGKLFLDDFSTILAPRRVSITKNRRLRSKGRFSKKSYDSKSRVYTRCFDFGKGRRESMYIENFGKSYCTHDPTPRKVLRYDEAEYTADQNTFRVPNHSVALKGGERRGRDVAYETASNSIIKGTYDFNKTKRDSRSRDEVRRNVSLEKQGEKPPKRLKQIKSSLVLHTKSQEYNLAQIHSTEKLRNNKSIAGTNLENIRIRGLKGLDNSLDSISSIVEPSTGGRVMTRKIDVVHNGKTRVTLNKENNPFSNQKQQRYVYDSKCSLESRQNNRDRLRETSCFFNYQSEVVHQTLDEGRQTSPFEIGSLEKNNDNQSAKSRKGGVEGDDIFGDDASVFKFKKKSNGDDQQVYKGKSPRREIGGSFVLEEANVQEIDCQVYEESKSVYSIFDEDNQINNTVFTVTSKKSTRIIEKETSNSKRIPQMYLDNIEDEDLLTITQGPSEKTGKNKSNYNTRDQIRKYTSGSNIEEKSLSFHMRKQTISNHSSVVLTTSGFSLEPSKSKLMQEPNLKRERSREEKRYRSTVIPIKEKEETTSKLEARNVNHYSRRSFKKTSSSITFDRQSSQRGIRSSVYFRSEQKQLTQLDKEIFSKFFIDLIKDFRELESIKQKLSIRPDFNLRDFFNQLNTNSTGELDQAELSELLQTVEIGPHKELSSLLIERFDKRRGGRLSFKEFSHLFKPFNEDYSKRLLTRGKRGIKSIRHYSDHTLELIKQVLEVLISNERNFDHHRELLGKKKDLYFDLLDAGKKGCIRSSEMRLFMSEIGFKISKNELEFLVFRFDWKENGMVSYGEFVNEMTPKEHNMPLAKNRSM